MRVTVRSTGSCMWQAVQIHVGLRSTPCEATLSNNTTRPPLSPVARCWPLASNSMADMMSAAMAVRIITSASLASKMCGTTVARSPYSRTVLCDSCFTGLLQIQKIFLLCFGTHGDIKTFQPSILRRVICVSSPRAGLQRESSVFPLPEQGPWLHAMVFVKFV